KPSSWRPRRISRAIFGWSSTTKTRIVAIIDGEDENRMNGHRRAAAAPLRSRRLGWRRDLATRSLPGVLLGFDGLERRVEEDLQRLPVLGDLDLVGRALRGRLVVGVLHRIG